MDPEIIARFISEDMREGVKEVELQTRPLGKTNFNVPILSLGGQGSLEHQGNEKNCINIIQRAYELGVRLFDTASIYGPSEDYYGKALKGFRKKIFLNTKTDNRTRDGSLKLIEKSLKRLKTDYVDLWQIHHLDKIEEVDEVSKENGALQALIEMKEQKVVRHIGFTGHENPKILIEMSKRHNFDTVLMPINAADIHVKPSFIEEMLPVANKQKLGIIGMKVFAQGYIFDNSPKGITTVWEPIHYALSCNISTIIVGCDSVAQLEENVMVAKMFSKLSQEKMKEIEEKTKHYVKRAAFFRSKFGGYNSKKKLKNLK